MNRLLLLLTDNQRDCHKLAGDTMLENLNSVGNTENFDTLIQHLKQQGYILIKSFFKNEEINPIKNLVMDILQEKGYGYKENENIYPSESINRIGSPNFIECIKSIMAREELHLISLQGKLPLLMSQLLCDEIFSHPRKMIRISYPSHMNPNDIILPHQDLFYVRGEKDTLTAWIPLGDYPVEFGGLKIAHGSHKKGLFPVNPNSEGRFNCAASNLEKEIIDWRTAHYEIGDLLIFHSLTLHAGGDNLSKYFRLSLDCRFSSLIGTINEEQLLPPYHPKIPEWKKLTSQWTSNPFITPSSLQIKPSDEPLETILRKKSLFV